MGTEGFLCMTSCDSVIMLCCSGLLGRLGGELGGVAVLLMFCMEPGGEELGVMMWKRAMGGPWVLRARGDTGVCFRLR